MSVVGFCRCSLSSWGSYPLFLVVFITNGCWILSIFLMDHSIWLEFFLQPADVVNYIHWFLNAEASLHIWNKCHLDVTCVCFHTLLDWFINICLKLLHIFSWVILVCSFHLLEYLYSVIILGQCWPHRIS